MKKIVNITLGIWCIMTAFVSPIWLTLAYMNINGSIYDYDLTMDSGTALIFGIFMLAVWILFVLLPDILFVERMYKLKRGYAYISLAAVVLFAVLCLALCRWDVVGFLSGMGFL